MAVYVDLPTPRQAEYLRAIVGFWVSELRPPTIRDLCVLLGVSSPNGVVCQLKALLKKNLVDWDTVNGTSVGVGTSRSLNLSGVEDELRLALRGILERRLAVLVKGVGE